MNKKVVFDQVGQFVEKELELKENEFQQIIIPNYEDRISFIKYVNGDIINYISVNYSTRYGETVISNYLTFYIASINVNRIFYNVYNKYDRPIFPEMPRATLLGFPEFDIKRDTLHDLHKIVIVKDGIINKASLQICCGRIIEYIEKYVYPFFQKVDSIQTINDEIINKIPHMEVSNYIDGANAPWIKLIIMKLCNNPGYGEYTNWLEETFERLLPTNPSMYEPKFQIFRELKELLDSGKYQELIQ